MRRVLIKNIKKYTQHQINTLGGKYKKYKLRKYKSMGSNPKNRDFEGKWKQY